jgi:hypothetical protein
VKPICRVLGIAPSKYYAVKARERAPSDRASSVFLAASPEVEGVSGRYLEDANEARIVDRRGAGFDGVAAYALDPANAARLWEVCTMCSAQAEEENGPQRDVMLTRPRVDPVLRTVGVVCRPRRRGAGRARPAVRTLGAEPEAAQATISCDIRGPTPLRKRSRWSSSAPSRKASTGCASTSRCVRPGLRTRQGLLVIDRAPHAGARV